MTYNWDEIRIFLAIVRHGSLPEAAKTLKIAHSTVFRRLNAFEQQIGVRLFDRNASGFTLTAAGESMLDHAHEMESRAEQIARNISGHDYNLTGTIRITTTHGLSLCLMAPVFKAFTDHHPDVCLDIQWGEQVRKLNKYESDVIILPSNKPPEHAYGRKIGRMAFGFFASTAYLQACDLKPTLENLRGHKVIGLSDGFASQPFFDTFTKIIKGAKTTVICDSFLTVREAVAAGAGIGLMPIFYGTGYKTLEPIGKPITNADNEVWILTHRDLKNTVRVRSFMDFAYTQIHPLQITGS